MAKHRRARRKQNDRGSVTVETAIVLSAFVIVLGLTLAGLGAAVDKVRCIDAAREAARLTARGDPEQAQDAAAQIAPSGAAITIHTEGEHIHVNVRATPAAGLLPGVHVDGEAFAVREPAG